MGRLGRLQVRLPEAPMSNERLRAAILESRLTISHLADQLAVDPKTVHRWLGGRVPHPRHRYALAAALSQEEEYLWPSVNRSVGDAEASAAELVGAYPFRADVDAAHWWSMITKAKQQIDLLGYTLYFLPQQHPQLIPVLLEKCAAGCTVRLVLADPSSRFVRLRELEEQDPITLTARIQTSLRAFRPLIDKCAGAELRFQDAPLYSSVFRFDDEMFVTPHLYATPGHRAPLLHLRRLGPNGLFSRFAAHFESIWTTTTAVDDSIRQPVHLGD
jgi:transcriptional regulator with XRE-family HTH domain